MKLPLLLISAGALALAGCKDNSSTPAPTAATNASSSSGSPLTAPVDYLSAVAKAQQSAVKTIDTVSLDQAIQQFGADKGRNPKDLNELVEQKYIPKLPQPPYGTKLVYDAATGTVKVEKE
jgi:outer membrane murein-binding lipoprotein Lpp